MFVLSLFMRKISNWHLGSQPFVFPLFEAHLTHPMWHAMFSCIFRYSTVYSTMWHTIFPFEILKKAFGGILQHKVILYHKNLLSAVNYHASIVVMHLRCFRYTWLPWQDIDCVRHYHLRSLNLAIYATRVSHPWFDTVCICLKCISPPSHKWS